MGSGEGKALEEAKRRRRKGKEIIRCTRCLFGVRRGISDNQGPILSDNWDRLHREILWGYRIEFVPRLLFLPILHGTCIVSTVGFKTNVGWIDCIVHGYIYIIMEKFV